MNKQTIPQEIEGLLQKASVMVNAQSQIVIWFDKPDHLTLESVQEYLVTRVKTNGFWAGCGDIE